MYGLKWFGQSFAFTLVAVIFSLMLFGGAALVSMSAILYATTLKDSMLAVFFSAMLCMWIGMLSLSQLGLDDACF
jgi:energy-converting hydrogenase Eha subunit H